MTVRRDVSVLYVDPHGPYPSLVEDWWDETRDAKWYKGPNPVVAHPPCAPWTTPRTLCARDHEKGLGVLAVEQVRRWGGVLEQPSGSRLWDWCLLPRPGRGQCADRYGYSIEVEQVRWGRQARKRTWLYLVGVTVDAVNGELRNRPPIKPTHWCSGVHTKGARGETPPGIKVCSAQQRRRTPVAFAEWLVSLAAGARR
jgi:hypothetical protein